MKLLIQFIEWEDYFNSTLLTCMPGLSGKDYCISDATSHLQAELYQGLAYAIQASDGNIDGSLIGKKVILPSSFTGSSRYQHQLYQDAMAIVHCYGKTDVFITFTCNPQWKEITDELLEHQTAADQPGIVAQVFKLKLHSLLEDLFYGCAPILGKMVALIYVIEWQK